MMFLLDLYKFCESYSWFNRQHLAKFVFQHRECERLARAANMTPRKFASSVSLEFIPRMCTLGYLGLDKGVVTCYGSHKRPFRFELYNLEGERNKYIYDLFHMDELSDEELFCSKTNRQDIEALRRKFNLA
ncbi:hypothetical protein [Escherichia phage vB_EcoS_PHB17]|uniref:YdbL n=1 Tax=Escherichia phage vB_EcoS_PHB17 TaxID=2591407 RepID=A0A514DKV1_9CAUD|nr:hypothetical protein KMB84_gp73 [Escherichia phage vB_EcoS_PHB17]QDH94276.1 hypothetical protein [Escherichia phage vB_EcoS_PHB17]